MENEDKFYWTDWEHEADFEPGREGVYFLTIHDPEGEEYAIIVHRTCDGAFPLDGVVAEGKRLRAETMVDMLNSLL